MSDSPAMWQIRAAEDCVGDFFAEKPFASVGGLFCRGAMKSPSRVPSEVSEDYLAGYRAAARTIFGDDWETCCFEGKKLCQS
jgi:hypothetical protein